MSTLNSWEKEISYLDPLQSGGGLGDTLWHIKAFGGADFGVDQPLLEVSQGCTEPLLQQALLILTLPGCTKTEAGGIREMLRIDLTCSQVAIHFEKWTKEERKATTRGSICCLLPMCSSKQGGYMCRCSAAVHTVLTLWRRRRKESLGDEQEWETGRWSNGKVGEVEAMSVGAKRESGGWW